MVHALTNTIELLYRSALKLHVDATVVLFVKDLHIQNGSDHGARLNTT